MTSNLLIDDDRTFLAAVMSAQVGDWAGKEESIIAEICTDSFSTDTKPLNMLYHFYGYDAYCDELENLGVRIIGQISY